VLAVTWGVSYLVLPSTQLAETAAQIRASALYFQNWQLASEAVNYLQSGQRSHPGPALLVTVGRGAVLPSMAAAIRRSAANRAILADPKPGRGSRVTFAGSIIPAATRSSKVSVAAL